MLERLISILWPPKEGANEHQLYWWRVTMAIAVITMAVVFGAHMAWSVGYGPFAGDGFVRQAQFQELAEDSRQSRLNTLRTTIIQLKRENCMAKPSRQPDRNDTKSFKTVLAETLSKLLEEWRDLEGHDFPALSCADL